MAKSTGIPGWPIEFMLNESYGAKCHVCGNESTPIGIHSACSNQHSTCRTCFDKHSYSKTKAVYECPKCVYNHMVKMKKNIEEWMEEKSFVNAAHGAGAFFHSKIVAEKKASLVEMKPFKEIVKWKSMEMSKPMVEPINEDIQITNDASSRSIKVSSSSVSSKRKIEYKGKVEDYVRIKQVDDCECCKAALCMDCIWELAPGSS